MSTAFITDPLKCGECKGEAFSIVHVRSSGGRYGGGGYIRGHLIVQCLNEKCHSKSIIRPMRASFDDTDGPLCGGWSS